VEGDLIIGLNRSAIGTLVERTTRFTMLLHLPRIAGYGIQPRIKNGPAFAGYGAEAVRDAITSSITTLPAQLRRSLTWDRGKEMARHAELRIETGLEVYFCDPYTRGSAGRTRTPTDCYASTSRKERTFLATDPPSSRPSLQRSTAGPARPSTGRPQPKP